MHEEQEDVGSFEDLGLDDRILKVCFYLILFQTENIFTDVSRGIMLFRNYV